MQNYIFFTICLAGLCENRFVIFEQLFLFYLYTFVLLLVHQFIMKIIIAGAGEVGFHLAKLLTHERQEIVIIDLDQERLNYAASHLDVHTVKGSSTSFKFLEAANVSKSDLLISVTSSEETNLATCIIAKKLGAKKTIARIDNTEYLTNTEKSVLLVKTENCIANFMQQLPASTKDYLQEVELLDFTEFKNIINQQGDISLYIQEILELPITVANELNGDFEGGYDFHLDDDEDLAYLMSDKP